ncbi:rhamnosyl transferase [Fragilaria crotonensis]|nr:rhamnosyl transferase [Fragilaria crotonensis]
MAPLFFEFPISVTINGGMVSRRSTKSQTSITSQTLSAKGKKSVRKGNAFLSRIVLIAWLLIGAIGVAAIGTMYASVDLDVKAPHPARYLRMVPDESFAGYANATLAFWDFASDKAPVQVIQTRFMQFQPHLLALGEARLKIFATFCLPSILAQSSKKFLWLIRADPDLDPALKDPLIAMIQQYPNILLVGSNQNPEGFRHRASVVDITPSNVWSGSYELL